MEDVKNVKDEKPTILPLNKDKSWNYDYDFWNNKKLVYFTENDTDIIVVSSVNYESKNVQLVSSALYYHKYPLTKSYPVPFKGYICSIYECNNICEQALQLNVGGFNICDVCLNMVKDIKVTNVKGLDFSEYFINPKKSLLCIDGKFDECIIYEKWTLSLSEHYYPIQTPAKDRLFVVLTFVVPEVYHAHDLMSKFVHEFSKPIFMRVFTIKYWLLQEYIKMMCTPKELSSIIITNIITNNI